MMPTYLKNLLEADCRASQLRVLAEGPPIYVKVACVCTTRIQESSIFPCPEGQHVEKLWYSSTQKEKSAKVEVGMKHGVDVQGCLEGEEREKWWNEMKEILSLTEQEIKEKEEMLGKAPHQGRS